MAVEASPIKKVIIVGAGASMPYDLPSAAQLIESAQQRVQTLAQLCRKKTNGHLPERYEKLTQVRNLLSRNELDEAIHTVAFDGTFRRLYDLKTALNDRAQLNLDEFVRDNPRFTDIVPMLIAIELFVKMYQQRDGRWILKPKLAKGGRKAATDWMLSFVNVIRPKASKERPIGIISFNYDALLEQTIRAHWGDTQVEYPPLDECIDFVYPNGKFSELPADMRSCIGYLQQQAKNLRLGDDQDLAAHQRAQELIAEATRIYSVGFSFSPENQDLLKLADDSFERKCVVQNYGLQDIRLNRLMDRCRLAQERRDPGDMDTLIRNGFFDL